MKMNTTLLLAGAATICGLMAACDDDSGSMHEECVGFVIASDGSVHLSELSDAPSGGDDHGTDDHDDEEHVHGECIAISTGTSFSTATIDGAFTLDVTSVRGAMTADAPDHEAIAITITDEQGAAREGATVVVKARMPHHDHMVEGGHGPANDMQVAGLPGVESAGGVYTVDPIDFQMTKYWFFTVEITVDASTYIAFFATEVAATDA
jgi:hypothetical protein